jgi:hypothetical protein
MFLILITSQIVNLKMIGDVLVLKKCYQCGGETLGTVVKHSVRDSKGKGLHTLLRELSDDEEEAAMDTGLLVPDDPQRPWLRDYLAYMDVLEQVPEKWSAIQWWGVSILVSIF